MPFSDSSSQKIIDDKNAAFWDTLCGSQLAISLGVVDYFPQSLKKFDDWYMEFYPYLYTYIPFKELKGKKVLEIGLGYGTISQKIAEAGANYLGLDIAEGPVGMVNHRLKQANIPGEAVQGSALKIPCEDDSFDWVVAIGCLHHTGNLALAIDEVHRILKPGGNALIMVYNGASYRQYLSDPLGTSKRHFLSFTNPGPVPRSDGVESARAAYDVNLEGEAAPQTEFVTPGELKYLCRKFALVGIQKENISQSIQRIGLSRHHALTLGRIIGLGLDLYCELKK